MLSVAFSPTGDRLASAGDDGSVRLWDAVSGECLRCHCASADRDVAGLAVWRPPRVSDPSDGGELIKATGDAWRYLAWQAWDHPSAPGRWTRLPLVY